MRDLLVSAYTPVLRSGRAMRTYGVARALSGGGDGVAIVYARFGAETPDDNFRSIPGVDLHEVVPSRGVARAAGYAAARLRGVPEPIARGASGQLAAAAERLAQRLGGRIIADGPVEAAALWRVARRRPVIYNAHNIESGFRAGFDAASFGDPDRLRRFERAVLERCSEAWVVSEADAAAARRLCPQTALRIVPNVVDTDRISPHAPAPAARRILLVANFAYEPNRLALQFLLQTVLPRVWAVVPETRLRVVGPGLAGPPSPDPRIEWLGFVEDLDSAYRDVSCVVVPLLHSGGTPVKFVEALAYGLPVVATHLAAQGLAVRDGVHCLLADGDGSLADPLARVLRDGAPELGASGRELAERCYSIRSLAQRLRPDGGPSPRDAAPQANSPADHPGGPR